MEHVVPANNLYDWGLSKDESNFLLKNHNALLFGAIFDYGYRYKKAWQAPFELNRRIGHLDLFRIAKMPEHQLLPYFQRGQYGQALHRFPRTLTKWIISASKKLVNEYGGNASNIWPNGTMAKTVLNRLEEFDGIGQKKSRMMGRFLGTYFGVSLTNWNEIDIAVDRHVARVFLRTGLVHRKSGGFSVAELRDEVIQCARKLRPSFPGCLDEPAFEIGRDWCTAQKAYCEWEGNGGPCPIKKSCRKKTHLNIR